MTYKSLIIKKGYNILFYSFYSGELESRLQYVKCTILTLARK